MIEVKEEDNLDIYSLLEMDNSIHVNNPPILHENVYLLHFPEGVENVQFSKGKANHLIKNINLITNIWTEPGSSGAPIINHKNNYVIGIHRSSSKMGNEVIGFGIIINYAVKKFSEEKSKEIKNSYKSLYPSKNTMDMIYLIPNNQKNIKLFNSEFVDKYKKKCILIYNGELYILVQYFNINNITNKDKNKGEIRITLKGIKYIKDMEFMFYKCNELKKVIATGTDFSKVEIMRSAFEQCENLEEITNTSNWNLENVKSLRGLFYICPKLKDVPGIDKWNPTNLKTCYEMFKSCKSLKSSVIVKVENWKNVSEDIKEKAKKGITVKDNVSLIFEDLNIFFSDLMNKIRNSFSEEKIEIIEPI